MSITLVMPQAARRRPPRKPATQSPRGRTGKRDDTTRWKDGTFHADCDASELGDSCGHSELPRRDADEALEVTAELALVREAGAQGDLRQGQVRPCLHELLGPRDAPQDAALVR